MKRRRIIRRTTPTLDEIVPKPTSTAHFSSPDLRSPDGIQIRPHPDWQARATSAETSLSSLRNEVQRVVGELETRAEEMHAGNPEAYDWNAARAFREAASLLSSISSKETPDSVSEQAG